MTNALVSRGEGVRGSLFPRIPTFVSPVYLVACVLFLGCAGVVPLPTRTKGPAGAEAAQKVDVEFIRVGQTSRAEVLEKLKWADVGVQSDNFFLGRWSTSTFGTFVVVAGLPAEGYGAARRHWAVHNALVEFDDKSVVKRYAVFGDTSLVSELSRLAAQEKTVDLAAPKEISVEHLSSAHASRGGFQPAKIILSRDFFEFKEDEKERHNFKIALAKVTRVGPPPSGGSDATYIRLLIHFAQKTKAGKVMEIRITVPDLTLLLKFLAQNQT